MVMNFSRVVDTGNDGKLLSWIISHRGVSFDANAFYPHQKVLAYSDMLKISGLVTWPFVKILENPGVASGAALVLGQVSTGLILFLWWKKEFGNGWSAAIGVITFLLSKIRFEYQVHLQMWGMQYWLVGSWLVGSWLIDKKNWKLYLGAVLLGLQMWESPLPVFFALTVIGARFLMFRSRLSVKHLLFAVIIFGSIIFPVVKAYRGVSNEFNFVRGVREAAQNSISTNELWGRFWSPGLVVLFSLSLLRRGTKREVKWLWVILFTGLIMSMGPVLKWQDKTVKIWGKYPVPLPYAAAYYLVPGMNAFRVPSRWLWVVGFAASGLIAAGLSNTSLHLSPILGERDKERGISIGVVACLVVGIIGGTRILKTVDLPSFDKIPNVYKWLASQKVNCVIEVPVYTWGGQGEVIETSRMYYSVFHQKNLVNGYSGFIPPNIYSLAQNIRSQFAYISQCDVIVHKDETNERGQGKIVYEDEKTVVYSHR